MKKPDIMKISDDVWDQTSTSVQESVTQLLNENKLLQKRVQRLRTATIFTSILAVGLVILFAVVGNLFVRPYLRVIRVESDVVIPCVYRPAVTYRVNERDTLFGISIFYDVPVEAIASANGITDINRIRVGREITIPESPCVDPAVNTRVAGEPLTATISMARAYINSTRTMSVWMTQYSPANLTTTAIGAETATAQYTPPNLTQTTATPTFLDPLELTATDIIGRATQAQIEFLQTSAAETSTIIPSPATPTATTIP